MYVYPVFCVCTFVCTHVGKPRSDSRIVKRKIATTPGVVNDSLSNINGQQNLDLLQQQHTFKNDDTSKAKKHSLSDGEYKNATVSMLVFSHRSRIG